MHLVVVSHKICWRSLDSPSGYVTDGGFPLQMQAISELFSSTELVLPSELTAQHDGASPLKGRILGVKLLTCVDGSGFHRRINMLIWLVKNVPIIWRAVQSADAVHTPIPGDIGTIGMIFAMLQRKPLFVRHCGNWFVQRTVAERFWKWSMEKFAGGRNVMLATGGADEPPSKLNSNIRWIFSTSLRQEQLLNALPRELSGNRKLRMIIACRQEEGKGTALVIDSLPIILGNFPYASLDVVGGGSLLGKLKEQVKSLRLDDKVTFHGKVVQARVVELLRDSDIFCYPTSASEGFPKVVIEALACGLPVVTTRVSVLPQLIGSGCGALLDKATPEDMAVAVREICSDRSKYTSMSARAIETARQYTLENWRDSIGEALRKTWKVANLSAPN